MTDTDAVNSEVQDDSLISIYVGAVPKPLMMPKSILERSSQYFVKALKHSHLGTGETNTLRFPEDDLDGWTVVLYWMVNREVPGEPIEPKASVYRVLIACWIMGDRYDMPAFQDVVMMELLNRLDVFSPSMALVKLAFESTIPGSKLRLVMAEELGWMIKHGRCGEQCEELDCCDGILDFTSAIAFAMRPGVDDLASRLPRASKPENDRWCEFLIGELSPQHWIFAHGGKGIPRWQYKGKE